MIVTRTARRRSRGFSVLEIVVAAGVSVGFALIVSSALVSTSRLAHDTIGKAAIAQDTREIAELGSRYLTGATHAGTCDYPKGVTDDSLCERIAPATGAIFAKASRTEVEFTTYGTLTEDEASADTGALRVPDKVNITTAGGRITVTRFKAVSDQYVNPAWATSGEVIRVVTTSSDQAEAAAFQFYDKTGVLLTDADLATDAGRQRIAAVQFTAKVVLNRTLPSTDPLPTSELDIFAAVDGSA